MRPAFQIERVAVLIGLVFAVASGVHAQSIGSLSLIWRDDSGKVLARDLLSFEDVLSGEMLAHKQKTPWTAGEDVYTGPLLRTLALRRCPRVASATFFALNDYYFSMPASDWESNSVILAALKNGSPMPIDDKGPYWVMYSLIEDPKYAQQPFRSRMVWQVERIEFSCKAT